MATPATADEMGTPAGHRLWHVTVTKASIKKQQNIWVFFVVVLAKLESYLIY